MSINIKDEYFNSIINALREYDEVDAIALGGSRSTGICDEKSDYDIYVYCKGELTNEMKSKAITPHCLESEIGNHYWELEDNCTLKNGIEIDIIYRKIEMFSDYLKIVVDEGNAFNGYTTCFWHNITNCKVLFDKSGEFTEIQKKYTIPYPEKLRQNIIEKNRKLLSGKLPSYDKQIAKASKRGDIVSVHHRTTEFLASYFDIIFALNRQTHPGEKKLISLCKSICQILPESFEENLTALLKSIPDGNTTEIISDMIAKLDKVIEKNL